MLRRFAVSGMLAALALTAAARTRPHYGGTLRVEIEGDPWQRPGGMARRLVLDGLTRVDADGSAQPALAVEWKPENDNHRWQFRLRPGVHFQDGSPLTSIAVVASLNAACPSNCPWTAIHAVAGSVIFTGDAPMPNLPELLAGDEYLIALTVTADGKPPEGIVGTGAFQVTGFANGVLTLAANEGCWQGRPFPDAVEIHLHRAIRDQWLDLGVGRADLVEIPPEQLRQAQQQRLTVLSSAPVTLLALEVADSGALANPLLRQSIALAIDRSALANVIYQKQGEVTASLLPANLSGYAFLFPVERNLGKAQELRGGLTPPRVVFAAEGGGAMQLAAQRIALNLREAGFNVQTANSGAQHADLTLRQFPLECGEPQAALESIVRGAGLAMPGVERSDASLFHAENEILSRDVVIPLLYLPRAYAVSGRVRDLHLDPDGSPALADASLLDWSRPDSSKEDTQ
ncbi:MAG: ABC transporter substrate-binding protein [Terracidiphilus sp.]